MEHESTKARSVSAREVFRAVVLSCSLFVLWCISAPSSASADEAKAPTATAVAFPGIRIFPAEKRLEADGAFAIVDPAYFLEYVAVTPQGKVHESLLELQAAPDKLNLGLILCGLEPRPEVQFQGEPIELSGPRVVIEVAWKKPSGEVVRYPVEALVNDARNGAPIEAAGFAFTGSRFLRAGRSAGPGAPAAGAKPNEVFAANASGSAISLYHDPDAVLDYAPISGGDVPLLMPTFRLVEAAAFVAGDERFRPVDGILPPHRTPVVIHVRPR